MQKILIFDRSVNSHQKIKLRKEGRHLEIIGLILGRAHQSISVGLETDLLAPRTSCQIDFRIVLRDSATCHFRGLIRIAKNASRADAFLRAKTLLLSKDSKAEINPSLEIEANDISAGHAATVGRLDQEQIYYLLSRGLTRIEAENLITEGFLQEALARIKNVKIRKVAVGKARKFLRL